MYTERSDSPQLVSRLDSGAIFATQLQNEIFVSYHYSFDFVRVHSEPAGERRRCSTAAELNGRSDSFTGSHADA